MLVMVAAVRGSAPRAPGAAMVVTAGRLFGTIGGGRLELAAIEQARAVLAGQAVLPVGGSVRRHLLGTEMGQCCGGVVFLHAEAMPAELPPWIIAAAEHQQRAEPAVLLSRVVDGSVRRGCLTAWGLSATAADAPELQSATEVARTLLTPGAETPDLLCSVDGARVRDPGQPLVMLRPIPAGDFRLVLFGAGHVGRALVPVLEPLLDRLIWCDGRPEQFPDAEAPGAASPIVERTSGDPFALIASMPADTYYLVMTHSHALDLALCEAVLQRRDFAYLGLIGSGPKRRRFEQHLRDEGLTDADLARLTCPVGIGGIRSKEPAAIAIAVAAQLLQVYDNRSV